ncbi:hypothetical protein EN745_27725 [Mesorhizobium sp. M4A.F.Ca.ET.022.05.2.1]|uniref:hypothetical protein n=1 Tax=Mesorhizobium sp. M4A.F.Ca.ET.022.05.2.1 TaxID=2496653 RepID=UPI000FCA57DE|nr:hypothetical protein [Mesorhizobium sp. M4A.F.Ca.ET.022.05.2.1]RVC75353.1 hypothetical protein EN745_27725 [Mesorhizobium sp. M4A.F.Ca.ET.022.05.2.1]
MAAPISLYGLHDNAVLSKSIRALPPSVAGYDKRTDFIRFWDPSASSIDQSSTVISHFLPAAVFAGLERIKATNLILSTAEFNANVGKSSFPLPFASVGAWLHETSRSISSLPLTEKQKKLATAILRSAASCREDPPEITLLDEGSLIIEYNDVSRIVSAKISAEEAFLSSASSEIEVSAVIFDSESSAELLASRFLIELAP